MVGKILKDPEAYLDNIKCCRGPKSLQIILYFSHEINKLVQVCL